MRMIEIQQFATLPDSERKFCYLWTHIGRGRFYRVLAYNHSTGWANCEGSSFLVTPQETVYVIHDPKELYDLGVEFQRRLSERRAKAWQ